MTGLIIKNKKGKQSLKIIKLSKSDSVLLEGDLLRILPNGKQYLEGDRVTFNLMWLDSSPKVFAYITKLNKRN